MQWIKNWVETIILVILATSILEMLMPNNHFKKYIQMVMGILIIFTIIRPVSSLFSKQIRYASTIETHDLQIEKYNIQNNQALNYSDVQKEQIVDMYESKLKSQAQDIVQRISHVEGASVEVVFNNNIDSKQFGEIQKLNIMLPKQQEKNSNSSLIQKVKIEKIQIGLKKVAESESHSKETANSIKELKNSLSDFYNLSPTNINISVQKN